MNLTLPTEEIIKYWFGDVSPHETRALWFDTSPDDYITRTYKYLTDSITLDNYQQFSKTNMDKIALILIGDQFTRNIYRESEQRTKNDVWSLKLALEMIECDSDFMVPLHYRYFILLPLRHHKSSRLLHLVCHRIQLYKTELECLEQPIPKSLFKFYTHCIQNYTSLTDEIICDESKLSFKDEFKTVLENPIEYSSKDISIVPTQISNFITERQTVAVSLSGGVDSMVLLNALQQSARFHIIAIHIEYVNREESSIEREFLQYYCSSKGIRFYYRTIHYIKRHDEMIDRNLFEEETKKARFNLFKYVIDKEHLDGICVGHHMGDIVENIFTNMIKGRDLKNIKGMNEKQQLFGVTIYRPFLRITKDIIMDYAHYHKISYFLNSTPDWSCRGVLRNKVIPDLKNQFGEIEMNLILFAERVSFLDTFHQQEMEKRLLELEKRTDYYTRMVYCHLVIDRIESIVMKFMYENGYHMASKKTMNNLMKWLKDKKESQFQLNKDTFCFYRNEFIYFVNEIKIKNVNQDELFIQFDNYLPLKILLYNRKIQMDLKTV